MAGTSKYAREQEAARLESVKAYKKSIREHEEDWELYYKHLYEREQISAEQYATSLLERYERFAQHAKDVMDIHYMTEQEKAEISREFMQESDDAYTAYIKIQRDIEKKANAERVAEEKELAKAQQERIKQEQLAQKQAEETAKLKKEAAKAELDEKMDLSTTYVSDRNYYSDWEDVNDDPISAFKRVDQRLSDAVFAGTIDYDEYHKRLQGFGEFMYEDRIKNSNRWLAHEREMNRISAEDYIAGLNRMKAYTSEYYHAGIIDRREYLDGLRSLDERIFQEKKAQHQEILRMAEKEKAAIDEAANAKIDALEKTYYATLENMDEDDRKEKLADLRAQEKIYANAETKEGKDKLAQIRREIDSIKDEEKRIALRDDLEAQKESILASAEYKKNAIDRNAKSAAAELGLYYDEDTGYRMMSNANAALSGVLAEQESFSEKSYSEMETFNSTMTDKMNTSIQTVASGIMINFQSFAEGIAAIKNQIFSDVASINSLDFSRFGSSGSKTTVTYNDYGDKHLTSAGYASAVVDNLKSLMAKGGKL